MAVRLETRHARIVWRCGDAIGVVFVDPVAAPGVIPLDLARRLRDSENRALRQRLADQIPASTP